MIHECYHGVWPWIVWRIYICNVVKSKIIFALHSFAQKCVSGHHFFHFCTNIARCCVVAKIYILSARWSTDSWQRRKWGWKQLRTSLSLSSLAGQQRAGHCHLCGDSRTVGPVSRSGHKLHLSTCSCFHLPPPKVGSGHWPDIAYHALHTSALWMVLVVAFTKYVLCMFNLVQGKLGESKRARVIHHLGNLDMEVPACPYCIFKTCLKESANNIVLLCWK